MKNKGFSDVIQHIYIHGEQGRQVYLSSKHGACSYRSRGSYSDCITQGLEGAKGRNLHCWVSTEIASLVEVVTNMVFLQVSRGSSGVVRLAC